MKPPKATSIPEVLMEVGVVVGSTATSEAIKATLKTLWAKRSAANTTAHTDGELSERTQRALAGRLSVPFNDLTLLSIETADHGEAIGHFKLPNDHSYIISIKVQSGVTRITKLCLLYTSDAADEEDSVDLG